MKLNLTELLQRVGSEADVQFEEKVSYPEDGLVLSQPVKVKLHLTNIGQRVILKGTLSAVAELECSRCLKKVFWPLRAEVEEKYAKGLPPQPSEKLSEISDDDFIYQIAEDNTLDLSEMVRQNLLLALPLTALCQPECPGEKLKT